MLAFVLKNEKILGIKPRPKLIESIIRAMKTIRVFFAIDFSPSIHTSLARLISQCKATLPSHLVRFTPAENLHLTLKFLGEVEEAKLKSIYPAVHELTAKEGEFTFQLTGQGIFPNPARPSILWIGCANYAGLTKLAANLDHITTSIGVQPENRTFKPHLTIARVNQSTRSSDYPAISTGFTSQKFDLVGNVLVDHLTLYKSDLTPGGAKYTVVEQFPLASGPVNPD
jgi:RNA 2',3'-cyclic 3'-phosphodiesterase